MNIIISENLKELRKKKDNTQEDLAEFLTVSITAVSKWERGECYPDIEFLPKIASYYDVSVDDLLGVGEIRKKEKMDEYERRSYSLQLSADERYAIWREEQKEFPNDWLVLYNLMYSLFTMYANEKVDIQKKEAYSEECKKIGEKILAQCTIDKHRYGAIHIMCYINNLLGDIEEYDKYLNMAPTHHVTQENMKEILKWDKNKNTAEELRIFSLVNRE